MARAAKVGSGAWITDPAGTAFEVAAKTAFDVKGGAPCAYGCEFI